MIEKEFQNLKDLFLKLGGNIRFLKSIKTPSLENEAKLRYEIRKLKKEALSTKVDSLPSKVKDDTYHAKADFKDFLSEYPEQLHAVYFSRNNAFLKACSLKVKLNQLKAEEVKQAGAIQWEIWELFQSMDKAQYILDYWKENKRLLPTETQEDFSSIPPKKLYLKLRNLRSNRTKRNKTIQKMKDELPEVDHSDFRTKYNLLNKKIEELTELELQIEKLTNIINS